jgi:hypothetical protein
MNLKSLVLAGAIALPLHQPDAWRQLEYQDIEANNVSFTSAGMAVTVAGSASPLVYPMEKPLMVRRVVVEGHLSKLLDLPPEIQGSEGYDDFALKIGLVVAGDKTLGIFERIFGAKWLGTLFALAPQGSGIGQIHFLNAVQDKILLGRQRRHPQSDLYFENNVWLLDQTGDFNLSHTLDKPLPVVAIWVSIDGDDSDSSYTTRITRLLLEN